MENLSETVELMKSADYKERFKAEYYQLEIRYNKLKAMLDKFDKDELEFEPACPKSVLDDQLCAMKLYIRTLRRRAGYEDIDLVEDEYLL